MRSLPRLSIVLVSATLTLAACSDGGGGSLGTGGRGTTLEGTFDLVTVNGGPVPATVSSDLTFRPDGRVDERTTGTTGTTTVSLMYTRRGAQLLLHFADHIDTSTVSGNDRTIEVLEANTAPRESRIYERR